MSLVGVSKHGEPSLRNVLLKAFDKRGFVFFTNLGSRNAQDIGESSRVALPFPWLKSPIARSCAHQRV
jgi:pyridoxamine 5'-phosphate oxidase